MPAFRIWGRIEQVALDNFVAIVSATPEGRGRPVETADARVRTVKTFEEAEHARDELVAALADVIRRRGDEVAGVEIN